MKTNKMLLQHNNSKHPTPVSAFSRKSLPKEDYLLETIYHSCYYKQHDGTGNTKFILPHDAMLALYMMYVCCLSICLSQAGVMSKW